MREIKFRGKIIDNGEWVYGYYFKRVMSKHVSDKSLYKKVIEMANGKGFVEYDEHVIITQVIENGNTFNNYEVVDKETIGQSTGLFDKNGVEIYEGDIVKSHGFKVWCYDDKHDDIEYNTFYVRFGKYKQDGSGGEYIASNVLGFYLETIHDYDIVDYEETVSILSSDYDNLELEVIGNIHS